MISAFGVDHGEISKKRERAKETGRGAAIGAGAGSVVGAPVAGEILRRAVRKDPTIVRGLSRPKKAAVLGISGGILASPMVAAGAAGGAAVGAQRKKMSKRLPHAVARGGGGTYGGILRAKKAAGALPSQRGMGQKLKRDLKTHQTAAELNQVFAGQGGRRIRARMLNEDISYRQRGLRTGKRQPMNAEYSRRPSRAPLP